MLNTRDLLNSLRVSRVPGDNPELDLRILVLEFATFVLIPKGVSPSKLKEQLPALYDAVVKSHPQYNDINELFHTKNQAVVPGTDLASAVRDEALQQGIITLASALAEAQEKYLATVNRVQQVASEVLSANIRAVRRDAKCIKDNISDERVKQALALHDQYLETLAKTEKLVQLSLERINQEKNGREGYADTCNILTNAIKKSMRPRPVADRERPGKTSSTEEQESFVKKLRSKLRSRKITASLVCAVLPDIYQAIQPGFSDLQMQALVDLAEHYIRLDASFKQAKDALGGLPAGVEASLVKGGVKLQSPSEYMMAVAYDPMQMAVHYFNDEYADYLQPLYAAKDAASAVANAAYTAASLVATPFTYMGAYLFGPGKSYFQQISDNVFNSAMPLTEGAYLKAIAFHEFLNGLNEPGMTKECKEKLFNHYFKLNGGDSHDGLTFAAYEANVSALNAVIQRRDQMHRELYVMARVAQLQSALSAMSDVNDIQEVINELADYYHEFHSQPFFKGHLETKFHLFVPLICERLLVPVIFRLVDEGKVTKGSEPYHHIGAILKAVQKKQLITPASLGVVFENAKRDDLQPVASMIASVQSWVVGAQLDHVNAPELTRSLVMQSIVTDKRAVQGNIELTLGVIKPPLILTAVIEHLNQHIDKLKAQHLPEALSDIHEAKLKYCEAVSSLLAGVLNQQTFQDNKAFAKALTSFQAPEVPSLGKRQIARLLMRVADEFGPVTSSAEDPTPLVEKIMNFVVTQIDVEAVTQAYALFNQLSENRTALLERNQQDSDDLSLVWFDDETMDPFNMEAQGGQIAHSVIKHYIDALIGEFNDASNLESIIEKFKLIPGFAFVVEKLSAYVNQVLNKEKVVDLICQAMGLQVQVNIREQSYAVRLSHVFFKLRGMRAENQGIAESVLSIGLAPDDDSEFEKMCRDIEALNEWAQNTTFKPSEGVPAFEVGDGELSELKTQLWLTHCENLRKYAMRLADEGRRGLILLQVAQALAQLKTTNEQNSKLTPQQAATLDQLLTACESASETVLTRAKREHEVEVNGLSANAKQTKDELLSRVNRRRTSLNIILRVGFYLADLGLFAASVYFFIAPVMACVAAVKALSLVTLQTVSFAIGSTLIATPIGLAILGARFLLNVAYEAYLCRHDFRKDWKASETNLAKAGVIAKYALRVTGKALLSTFLTAALINAGSALISKVKGLNIPLVSLVQEKWSRKAKLSELEAVSTAFKVLRGIAVDDPGYEGHVNSFKERVSAMKYNKDKAQAWMASLEVILTKQNGVISLPTYQRVGQVLADNPPVVRAEAAPTWGDFTRARESGLGVIGFSRDSSDERLRRRLSASASSSDVRVPVSSASIFHPTDSQEQGKQKRDGGEKKPSNRK